jgi:hypothetical protein
MSTSAQVPLVIERYAEPLSGARGQLHIAVYVFGERVSELCHPLGSPAPWAVVKAEERTLTVTA